MPHEYCGSTKPVSIYILIFVFEFHFSFTSSISPSCGTGDNREKKILLEKKNHVHFSIQQMTEHSLGSDGGQNCAFI